MKRRSFFREIAAVLAAVGLVGLSSLVYFLLRQNFSSSVVALLYLVPVVISATLWGRLAGISASILSFLAFLYFFVPPYETFRVTHPQDFIVMVVLFGVAILTSGLTAQAQANLVQAKAREREAVQLYELSLDLTGKISSVDIAQTLAKGLYSVFNPLRVEVQVNQSGQSLKVCLPEDAAPSLAAQPTALISLDSPSGRLGEIRIWKTTEKPSPEETRLLQTFAGQGALALDRANLAAIETRTRILEESDRLKAAILSSLSHELRTPLATIQASATSLFNPVVVLEPAARAELQMLLLEETDRMIQLVGNLLNMSRIEANALQLRRQWNAIAEIVDTSVQRLTHFSTHPIEVDVSEDLPLVSMDAVLMEQVMINLVRNSLRFAPPNTPIWIRASTDDQFLEVTVSNAGPPIPEEYLEHIFEKFYPIPGRDSGQGTGLGLSICKGIVEAHGGKIWAANLPVGVVFHFTLPLSWAGVRPILPNEEREEA